MAHPRRQVCSIAHRAGHRGGLAAPVRRRTPAGPAHTARQAPRTGYAVKETETLLVVNGGMLNDMKAGRVVKTDPDAGGLQSAIYIYTSRPCDTVQRLERK